MSTSPTYPLEKIRWLLQADAFLITRQAIHDAFDLGLDRQIRESTPDDLVVVISFKEL